MTRLKTFRSTNRRARLGVAAALVAGLTLPLAAQADHNRVDDDWATLIGASIVLAHYDAPRYVDHRYYGHNYRHAKHWRKHHDRHAYGQQDRRHHRCNDRHHDRHHDRHGNRYDLQGDRRGYAGDRYHDRRRDGHRRG